MNDAQSQALGVECVSKALVEAQGELQAATFDAQNPFLKNRYASLGAIIAESRPVLAKHKLAILQIPTTENNNVSLRTRIIHESGQSIDGGTLSLPMGEERGKSLAQVAGSLITYLRRYAWASVLGMYAEEDTDGNEGPGKPPGAIPRQKPLPTPPEAPKTPPSPAPAPKTAIPAPSGTVANDKYRIKALNRLKAAPGQPHRDAVRHFLMSKGWLSANEEPEAWALAHVPTNDHEMVQLMADVDEFMRRMEVPVT